MTKLFKKANWKPVQLEGHVINDLQGLVGIEECTDYDIGREISNPKKRKAKNKKQTSQKKTKASTDVIKTIASVDNEDENDDDFQAWTGYDIPAVLVRAIKEKGFIQPTEIQRLTLPAAILGRRDILGAAETGSGKTLAFGIPILTGILNLKENEPSIVQSDEGFSSDNIEDHSELESESEHENDSEDNVESQSDDGSDEMVGKFVKPPQDHETESEPNHEKTSSDEEQSSGSDSERESEADDSSEEIGCVNVINEVKLEENVVRKPLYALILTPTRELAIQVKDHLTAIAKYSGIQIAVIMGGMAVAKQERILRQGPEIVVATPGRLWELIQLGNGHLSQVDKIRYLAIDETDRMLEKGHFQELQNLLERINFNQANCKKRQNFVFSATLTLVHELPRFLAVKNKISLKKRKRKASNLTPQQKVQQMIDLLGINNPKIVDVTQKTGTAETLLESRITCEFDEKDYYLFYFLREHPGRTLIFCNSIGCVKRLVTLLNLLGCKSLPLHASMQQRQRLKNLDRFRDNDKAVLVATDVAARGLDIPSIEHVLHYQTPRTSESYVHRSGRTARASNQGLTVLLVEPNELQNYVKLCKTLGRSEDLPTFPVQDKILNSVKEIVKFARELDILELRLRKNNTESGWLQKAAEDMDIIVEDEMYSYGDKSSNNEKSNSLRKIVQLKKKQLNQLLSKPIAPKGFSGKYPLISTGGKFDLEDESKSEKAVDILSTAIEKNKGMRSKPKWLFKQKTRRSDKNDNSTLNKNITKKKSKLSKNRR